jgi:ubiquinone/menaquinone biosynthesis C-methylase UbiE
MAGESGFQQSRRDAAAQYHDTMWRFCSEQVHALVGSVVRRGDEVLDVACGTGFAALGPWVRIRF